MTSRKKRCHCPKDQHDPKLVVVTGGPGAGKTAALDIVRRNLCEHIEVLPEAASLLYRGGFPRKTTAPARTATQRAIFTVQRELERIAIEERRAALILCDRGTIDGLAYWPGDRASFFEQNNTTRERELARYSAVIHMRTPDENAGYNQVNPLRVESSAEARLIDEALAAAWYGHPRVIFVQPAQDFLHKLQDVIALISEELPDCCRDWRAVERSDQS